MPRKKKTSFADMKFRTIHFNDREKSEYTSWIDGRDIDLEDSLLTFADNEAKASVSMNAQTGAYSTSLTFKNPNSPNHGTVFMFNHADLAKSVHIARFYFEEIMDGGSAPPAEDSDLDW